MAKIEIRISDKIDDSIDKKLESIERRSDKAYKSIMRLQKSLNSLGSGTSKVSSDIDKMNRSNRASVGIHKRAAVAADKQAKSIKNLRSSLHSLFILHALSNQVGQVIGIVDAYTNLNNKLKVVTTSEGQLATVRAELFEISKRSRVSIEETVTAFQRFDRAMINLGASQQETLRMTETINKSMTLSGLTTNEAAQGLLQLSQAFNKGKFDGDELRTLMETMPGVTDAVAKKMGVLRGALLDLGPAGKITAQVVREAIADMGAEVDRQFAQSIPTISQSLVVLRNEFIRTFGESSQGPVAEIARGILFIADNMETLLMLLKATAIAWAAWFALNVAAKILNTARAVLTLNAALVANPIGAVITALSILIGLFITFKDEVKLSSDGLVTFGDYAQATFESVMTGAKKLGAILGTVFDFVKNFATKAFDIYVSLYSVIFGFARKALHVYISIVNTVMNTLKLINNAVNPFKEFDIVTNKDAIKSVEQGFSSVADMVVGVFKGASNFIVDDFNKKMSFIENRARKISQARIAGQKQPVAGGALRGEGPVNAIAGDHGPSTGDDLGITPIVLESFDMLQDKIEGTRIIFGEMVSDANDWQLTFKDAFSEFGDSIADSLADAFVFTESFFENWKDGMRGVREEMKNVGKEILSSLIGSLIKLGVQQIANKLLGSSLTALLVGEGIVAASTLASAWATPASLASLATLGGNAVPAATGMTTVVGLGHTLAKTKGFKDGGYTGDGNQNAVAGVTHMEEFVVRANATKNNRAELTHLNKTGSLPNKGVNIKVENYGTNVIVDRIGENDIRIIARQVLNAESDGVLARTVGNANSDFSKSLSQNTNVQRRR